MEQLTALERELLNSLQESSSGAKSREDVLQAGLNACNGRIERLEVTLMQVLKNQNQLSSTLQSITEDHETLSKALQQILQR